MKGEGGGILFLKGSGILINGAGSNEIDLPDQFRKTNTSKRTRTSVDQSGQRLKDSDHLPIDDVHVLPSTRIPIHKSVECERR